MMAISPAIPRVSPLLRLGRISNVPTVWTNVVAGAVIAGDELQPLRVGWVMLAMTAFYVGGMYLNDFFDRKIDARERPGRPIHAGEISAGAVSAIGFGLLATGVVLMLAFGALAALIGLLLAGTILLYDMWHKGNAFSPIIMGLCRALVYLGAGAALSGRISGLLILGAFVLASHVAGLSYAAKQESLNRVGSLWPLALLAVPVLAALPALAGEWMVGLPIILLLAADGFALWLLARKSVPGVVPHAVSILIAAICLVDAVAIAFAGGGVAIVLACAAGYVLTRIFQASVPGT